MLSNIINLKRIYNLSENITQEEPFEKLKKSSYNKYMHTRLFHDHGHRKHRRTNYGDHFKILYMENIRF